MRKGLLSTNSNTQKVTETINHARGKKPDLSLKSISWTPWPLPLTSENSLLIQKHANNHCGLLPLHRWHQEITYNKTVLHCEFLSYQSSFCYKWWFYLITKLQNEFKFPTSNILEAPHNDEPYLHSKFPATITTTKQLLVSSDLSQSWIRCLSCSSWWNYISKKSQLHRFREKDILYLHCYRSLYLATPLNQNSSELKVVLTDCFSPTVSQDFRLLFITPIYPLGSPSFASQVTNYKNIWKSKTAYKKCLSSGHTESTEEFHCPSCVQNCWSYLLWTVSSTTNSMHLTSDSTLKLKFWISVQLSFMQGSPPLLWHTKKGRRTLHCCSFGLCCCLKVWTYLKTSMSHWSHGISHSLLLLAVSQKPGIK